MQDLAQIFVMCFSPAMFWLGFFFHRARYGKTHSRALLTMFCAGLVAGPLALLLFHLVEQIPFYARLTEVQTLEDESVRFAYAVFAIGPIEELSKFLLVWGLMFRRREFSSPIDGLTFAAAAGLGFASIENWYAMLAEGEVLWARAVTLPFIHVLFSSFWGVGLAFARFGTNRFETQIVHAGLPLAFVFHGIYDYITLSEQVPNTLILPLIFLLWLWVTSALRRLSHEGSLTRAFAVLSIPRGLDPESEVDGKPLP